MSNKDKVENFSFIPNKKGRNQADKVEINSFQPSKEKPKSSYENINTSDKSKDKYIPDSDDE